jgi:hypothetical protein
MRSQAERMVLSGSSVNGISWVSLLAPFGDLRSALAGLSTIHLSFTQSRNNDHMHPWPAAVAEFSHVARSTKNFTSGCWNGRLKPASSNSVRRGKPMMDFRAGAVVLSLRNVIVRVGCSGGRTASLRLARPWLTIRAILRSTGRHNHRRASRLVLCARVGDAQGTKWRRG